MQGAIHATPEPAGQAVRLAEVSLGGAWNDHGFGDLTPFDGG